MSVENPLDYWVTIFGFNPVSAKQILQDFAATSTVAEYRLCNETNWFHVKFATKLEVAKALRKNGKLFGRNTMIGVLPCTDSSVLLSEDEAAAKMIKNKENEICERERISLNSPLRVSMPQSDSFEDFVLSNEERSLHTPSRSLRQLNKPISQQSTVANQENSIYSPFSKAVEYICGR